jgi:hypothetical protein
MKGKIGTWLAEEAAFRLCLAMVCARTSRGKLKSHIG